LKNYISIKLKQSFENTDDEFEYKHKECHRKIIEQRIDHTREDSSNIPDWIHKVDQYKKYHCGYIQLMDMCYVKGVAYTERI